MRGPASVIAAAVVVGGGAWSGGCDEPEEVVFAPVTQDPAVVSALRIDPGEVVTPAAFSPDGRYAVFQTDSRYRGDSPVPEHIIVDTRGFTSVRIPDADELMFARDGRHVAVRIGREVSFYDLLTGEADARRWPLSNQLAITDDGCFVWANRTASGWTIHDYDAVTAGHVEVGDMPFSQAAIRNVGRDDIAIFADEHAHVVVTVPGQMRVWDHGDRRDVDPRGCAIEPAAGIASCSWDRIVTRGGGGDRLCVWDVSTRTMVTKIVPRHEAATFSCRADVIEVASSGVDGCTTYSATTGAKLADARCTARPHSPAEESVAIVPVKEARASPVGDLVAGTNADRGEVWSSAAQRLWQMPAPPEASAIGFGNGQLVVAGRNGELWRIDLATRQLHTSGLTGCHDPESVAIAPSGAVVAMCARDLIREVIVEGSATPVDVSDGVLMPTTVASSKTATSFVWSSEGHTQVWDVALGKRESRSYPHEGYPAREQRTAISPDGTLHAAVLDHDARLVIHDKAGREIAARNLRYGPYSLQFSPDGRHLAISLWDLHGAEILIVDATTAVTIDSVHAADRTVAWELTDAHAPRLAIVLDGGIVVLRDVEAKRDDEIRILPTLHDGVRALVWSTDGALAALAGSAVAVWPAESINAATIRLAGAGGIEIRADSSAHFLGGHRVARELFGCRSGNRTVPQAWCDVKLDEP